MQKVLFRLVPFVVIIAALVGFKYYNKSKANKQIREEAFVLVQDFPRYEEFKPYYDAAFDEHHGMAFDQSYKMGARRSGSTFDSDKYVAILVALIEHDAAEDGHAEIAQSLVLYRGLNGLPAVDLP